MNNIITITFSSDFAIWQAASIDKYETRPVLSCVRIDPSGLMLATDTHIAAIVPCTIEGAPADWDGALVPATFIRDLMKDTKGTEMMFSIIGSEAVYLGKKGKVSVLLTEGTFPRIDVVMKSAVSRAAESKGMTVCHFRSSLMDRVGQAIGYEKGGFVPHQWIGPEKPVLCYGSKHTGAVGLLMPAAQQMAEECASHGRDAMRSIIARLSGETCPLKKAA